MNHYNPKLSTFETIEAHHKIFIKHHQPSLAVPTTSQFTNVKNDAPSDLSVAEARLLSQTWSLMPSKLQSSDKNRTQLEPLDHTKSAFFSRIKTHIKKRKQNKFFSPPGDTSARDPESTSGRQSGDCQFCQFLLKMVKSRISQTARTNKEQDGTMNQPGKQGQQWHNSNNLYKNLKNLNNINNHNNHNNHNNKKQQKTTETNRQTNKSGAASSSNKHFCLRKVDLMNLCLSVRWVPTLYRSTPFFVQQILSATPGRNVLGWVFTHPVHMKHSHTIHL